MLIGALLTTRKPEQRISWGFAGTALLWAIAAGAYAYAFEALVAHPGSLPGGLAAAWLDNWLWLPTLVLPISLPLAGRPGWPAALPALANGPRCRARRDGAGLARALGFADVRARIQRADRQPARVRHDGSARCRRGRVRARGRRRRRLARVLRPALPPLARRRAPAAALDRRLPGDRSLLSARWERSPGASSPTPTSSTRSRCSRSPSARPSRSSSTGSTSSTSSSTGRSSTA